MLTLDQAKSYLASLGVTLPDTVLQLLVDQVNTIWPCLEENYQDPARTLIALYLIALLGIANGDKYVSSESAPSGASRSYRYQALADRWRSTYGLLRSLDTKGCTDGIVPADPTQTTHAGLWIAKGGCMCGGR